MNEAEARCFLLVRAIETEDRAEALLTREDRQQANAAALGGTSRGGAGGDDRLLARRADFALARLSTRFPAVAQAERWARWPSWLYWALPLGAFGIGLLGHQIDSGQRLNIIAFPLLGLIAWNLFVYLLTALAALRRLAAGPDGQARPPLLGRLLMRAGGPSAGGGAQAQLARAFSRFGADWVHRAGPLITSRASMTLSLAAAAMAGGVVAGMYLRALGVEYRAGWESTFIGSSTLHGLLALTLGPASLLTGIPLPGTEALAGLQWSAGRGVNAAPWIHLFAASAFIYVIAPRLLLALVAGLNVARRRRRIILPGREDFYVRRLLRTASGRGALVEVVPYSFTSRDELDERLRSLVGAALGDGTELRFDPSVAYGAEDEWLARAPASAEADHLVLLFNLSATPEAENHGAFAAGVAKARPGTAISALVEESAYRARLAGQSGTEARIAERRAAWERVLREAGQLPLFVDLTDSDETGLTRRLEAHLVRDPGLVPDRAA